MRFHRNRGELFYRGEIGFGIFYCEIVNRPQPSLISNHTPHSLTRAITVATEDKSKELPETRHPPTHAQHQPPELSDKKLATINLLSENYSAPRDSILHY